VIKAPNPMRPAAGEPRLYSYPPFTRHRLRNGLTVWLVPLTGRPLVNVHLLADAGAASEDELQGGVAALTAALLVTGTRRLDASAFAETTERLGIDVSSQSSWDSARAAFQAVPQHVAEGLRLLAEMIREPRFDPGEFERLRGERLAEILQNRATPQSLADEMFLRHCYGSEVPYRRLSAGVPTTVEQLTPETVHAFHAAQYAPDTSHLIIAGGFEPEAVVTEAERSFADWEGAGAGHRAISAEPASMTPRVVLVDRPGSVQSELRVGHPGIDRYDPRYFSATVMAALLGGVFGSRLNLRLREELGYTYGARAAFDPRRAPGPFTAQAAVHTEVTVPALRETLDQLDRMRNAPPDEAELREVKDFLIGVFPLRFETTAGIAGGIEPIATYGLADDWWTTYRERLEEVDVEDVHAAAQSLIRPDQLLILAVGDAERVRDELEAAAFGPLEVVEPS
jgi:zinc protease